MAEGELTAEGEPLEALSEWTYDPLYAEGWSVDQFMDAAVFGAGAQNGALRAVVVDAAAYGTRGHYAYPYSPMRLGYGTGGWRYGMGYGAEEVTTIETYDYGQMEMDAGVQAN